MPYTTVDVHEFEAEIESLKRVSTDLQRKLQLQESRLQQMREELASMERTVASLKSEVASR